MSSARPVYFQKGYVQMNKYITKIKSQIASLDKKIDALSGSYLTNTRKRQEEQRERDRKRNASSSTNRFWNICCHAPRKIR